MFQSEEKDFALNLVDPLEQLYDQALKEAACMRERADIAPAERAHLLHILKRRAAGYQQFVCLAFQMDQCPQALQWACEDRLLIFEGHQ